MSNGKHGLYMIAVKEINSCEELYLEKSKVCSGTVQESLAGTGGFIC